MALAKLTTLDSLISINNKLQNEIKDMLHKLPNMLRDAQHQLDEAKGNNSSLHLQLKTIINSARMDELCGTSNEKLFTEEQAEIDKLEQENTKFNQELVDMSREEDYINQVLSQQNQILGKIKQEQAFLKTSEF